MTVADTLTEEQRNSVTHMMIRRRLGASSTEDLYAACDRVVRERNAANAALLLISSELGDGSCGIPDEILESIRDLQYNAAIGAAVDDLEEAEDRLKRRSDTVDLLASIDGVGSDVLHEAKSQLQQAIGDYGVVATATRPCGCHR